MDPTKEQRKVTTQVSMAALAIDPRNPRPESVRLLRELNHELERILNPKNVNVN